jgi:predicted nuclease of predicted toxin-antitoxin system
MRFLVDECTGSRVANWLREEGHQVFSVYDQARGISDNVIINKAFGEKVYRENRPHKGIIFLRLQDERSTNKINVLQRLLSRYHQRIPDNFVVVTEKQVRFRTK